MDELSTINKQTLYVQEKDSCKKYLLLLYLIMRSDGYLLTTLDVRTTKHTTTETERYANHNYFYAAAPI